LKASISSLVESDVLQRQSVGDIDFGLWIEAEGADVPAGDVLQDVVANTLGESVPDDDVAEGLSFEVRRSRRVDDGQHVRFRGEVVDGLANLLQLRLQRLPVRMVRFVGEHGEMRQGGDRL
jgi:hypothetical protein